MVAENKSKTALITGASRGLGRALAEVFAKNHYNLILHSKSGNIELPDGIGYKTMRGDITSNVTVFQLTEAAIEADLDVLINNAGVY
jgi:3-oxoacyl-[acyl-carrier protein] reductase